MKKFKTTLSTPIIILLAGAAAGFFLLLKPSATLDAVIKIVGCALVLLGAINAIRLFLSGKRNTKDFMVPVCYIITGAVFMAIAHLILKLIPAAVGISLILLGAYKIRIGLHLREKNKNSKKWMIVCALSLLSIGFGAFVLLNPSAIKDALIRVFGGYLLIECAEDIYAYYLSR